MITSSSDVTTILGIPSMTALATLVQQLAENHVKDFVGVQELEQQTWTEYYPMDYANFQPPGDPTYVLGISNNRVQFGSYLSNNTIQLRQLPVRSITSLYEDPNGLFGQGVGAFPSNTLLTQGNDYYLKLEQDGLSWSGLLVRRSFYFPSIPGSLKVIYVAGFTAAELTGRWSVFRTAVLETIADLWLRAKSVAGGQFADVLTQTIGGGVSFNYVANNLYGQPIPDRAAERLQPYVVGYGTL